MSKFEGAGGTPGGIGEFIMGVLMSCGGAYMVMNQVSIHAGFYFPYFGSSRSPFGPIFTVFLLGLFFVFLNGKSRIGWFMVAAGMALLFFGILNSLELYYRPTNMLNTVIMFGLLFGGLGLIVRALKPH
ncbi:MAG: hypothetical protein HY815_24345 [Candidatus Riflebacteria bacterium]|nr:hypothetical protein [Candidatus Riflebacteria bacterium]